MANERTILVIGSTGAMGQYVIKHLFADETNLWQIRAFTRNPKSVQALRLAETGGGRVTLIKGDLNDAASLTAAMTGAYGVFCNTDFWASMSAETERAQGIRALETAKAAGIEHFVWSSLDDINLLSDGRLPCPLFDSKAAAAHEINFRRTAEYLNQETDGWYHRHTTTLVTLPYYENFQNFYLPERGVLSDGRSGLIFSLPVFDDTAFPMVALDDIGAFTRLIFAQPEKWGGRTLPIGSESLTLPQVAATFTLVTSIPAEFRAVPIEDFRQTGNAAVVPVANYYEFIQEYELPRNYRRLKTLHPGLLSFAQWLRQTGWRGEPREVQKGTH